MSKTLQQAVDDLAAEESVLGVLSTYPNVWDYEPDESNRTLRVETCPLAQFLTEQTGEPVWTGLEGAFYDRDNDLKLGVDLPPRIVEAVEHLDRVAT